MCLSFMILLYCSMNKRNKRNSLNNDLWLAVCWGRQFSSQVNGELCLSSISGSVFIFQKFYTLFELFLFLKVSKSIQNSAFHNINYHFKWIELFNLKLGRFPNFWIWYTFDSYPVGLIRFLTSILNSSTFDLFSKENPAASWHDMILTYAFYWEWLLLQK